MQTKKQLLEIGYKALIKMKEAFMMNDEEFKEVLHEADVFFQELTYPKTIREYINVKIMFMLKARNLGRFVIKNSDKELEVECFDDKEATGRIETPEEIEANWKAFFEEYKKNRNASLAA